VHILDDPRGLSDRARELLARTAWREPHPEPRIPTDFLTVTDRSGRQISAPMPLVIRREGFLARFDGLQIRACLG
jgi:hypothetical protein